MGYSYRENRAIFYAYHGVSKTYILEQWDNIDHNSPPGALKF